MAKREAEGKLEQSETGQSRAPVATWDVLAHLGFVPITLEGETLCLAYDFGNFKLEARQNVTRNAKRSAKHRTKQNTGSQIIFSTWYFAPGRCGELAFSLPAHCKSREEVIRRLVTALEAYEPFVVPSWFHEGQGEAALTDFENRPRCTVHKEWARLMLQALAAQLEHVPDGEEVRFSFDGDILRIRCLDFVAVAPAEGRAWAHSYTLKAEALRRLPHFLSKDAEFSVWQGRLAIGSWRYDGVAWDKKDAARD